jgi:hypothetical protein
VVAVPQRFEHPVGEAQRQDVVDRFLAQEVVDAKDLGLFKIGDDGGVEFLGRREVRTEGLLADDAGILVEPAGSQHLDQGPAPRWAARPGGRAVARIRQWPSRRPPPQLGQALRIVRLGNGEGERLVELVPEFALGPVRTELLDGISGVRAKLFGGLLVSPGCGRDDAIFLGHESRVGQMEQSGNDLALGEVSGGAEQHEDVVVGNLGFGMRRFGTHCVPPLDDR